MVKFFCWLPLLFPFFFTASALVDHLRQPVFSIKSNQTERSCPYTVIVKTSCSSISYTTDEINLAFGDVYDNEVYAPRIDDENTRTFERCSTYVFEVRGPCMDIICFLYLMRNGSDGWKPKTVMIYGPNYKPIITFTFDTFLPNGKWFGLNSCLPNSYPAFFILF